MTYKKETAAEESSLIDTEEKDKILNKPELVKKLETEGYRDVREINGKYYALLKFVFTTGLMCDLSEFSYHKRFCYEHYSDALKALNDYDGAESPTGPWIKEKGMDGERLNPQFGKDCFDCKEPLSKQALKFK